MLLKERFEVKTVGRRIHHDAAALGETDTPVATHTGIGRGGRRPQLLHTGYAGPDHPMLPQLAESGYLKALFFRLD